MRRTAERSPELGLRADDAENQTEGGLTGPRLIVAGDPAMAEMPDLIRAAFASMDGVIDPPSPRPHLTPEMRAALPGEVRAMGVPVAVCVMLTTAPAALCIGKLTVSAQAREMGLTQPGAGRTRCQSGDVSGDGVCSGGPDPASRV